MHNTGFSNLDRRVLTQWRLHALCSALVLTSVCASGTALAFRMDVPIAALATLVVVALVFWVVRIAWYPGALFRSWQYRIQKTSVELHHGVIVQKEVHIPMDRVQHVDVERGPLERRLGLARLILFTAGTKDARQVIPGLQHEQALHLRDAIAEDLNLANRDS